MMDDNGDGHPRARLRIEFNQDPGSGNWYFSVPALGVVGGGCESEEEMRVHALDAILFALADDNGEDTPGVAHLAVTVSAA